MQETTLQKSTGKILASNFSIKTYPPHWLYFKEPNYQRGVLRISAGAIEGHFGGKTPRKINQGGLGLARQRPGSPGTCNPEETGLPGLLDHPPYSPYLASSDYHLFPGLKNNWKVAIFSPTRGSLLPRKPDWTDNILILFLSGLQKSEQLAKTWIELRGEYVE